MLDERVRLIALTWLPANGGLINPPPRSARWRANTASPISWTRPRP